MLSTDERMERLAKRSKEMCSERKRKNTNALIISGNALCILLIAAVSYFAAHNITSETVPPSHFSHAASIFANGYFLGYTLVGILAFLLGVSVTFLCSAVHKRNKEEDGNDGRTDG